jgi:hypothetical protein
MTEAQAQHCERVAGIAAAGEDWWRLMIDEQQDMSDLPSNFRIGDK